MKIFVEVLDKSFCEIRVCVKQFNQKEIYTNCDDNSLGSWYRQENRKSGRPGRQA